MIVLQSTSSPGSWLNAPPRRSGRCATPGPTSTTAAGNWCVRCESPSPKRSTACDARCARWCSAPVEPEWLRLRLAEVAVWRKWDARTESLRPADPPADVARTIVAAPDEGGLPYLHAIVRHPVLLPYGQRISDVQRSDGWIETSWNNTAGGGEPPPLAGASVVVPSPSRCRGCQALAGDLLAGSCLQKRARQRPQLSRKVWARISRIGWSR
jgi:hypothetical protein